MTDPRSLCMNIIFYRPLSPATETHRPGTSLGFLPSEWSRAGSKGHIGASSAALLSGVHARAWSPRRPSRRSPRCKPRKGRLRCRPWDRPIIVRKDDDDEETVSETLLHRVLGEGREEDERARERERERRAVLQASVVPARAREERRACPAFPRRRAPRGRFSLTAAEPRLEHGVLPPRLVLLPVETHDGWCVRPQT